MSPSRRPWAARAGFSLIEVLVAIGLMAVGMLAVAPLFVGSMHGNATGEDYSMLNVLAKEQLEQILQYNFVDTRIAVPSGATVTLNNSAGTATVYSGQLYRSQTPTSQTIGGVTTTFPYELVYVVQDFNLDSNNRPDFTTPVDDANATWTTQNGVKLITVYAGSARTSLGKSFYDLGSSTSTVSKLLLSSTTTGKQVRMSAVKAP